MEHTTKDGQPRLIDTCTMPITAQGVVSLISTNLGLIEVTKKGFLLREIAKGYTPSEVQSLTGSQLHIAENLKETSTIDLQM
jgi:acyl CoA:acetate/3-ketoacid CoA transferase beta subunit